ncbi:MAG: glycosyltransferase family 39 protein, partial [Cytophagaceae bacterium]|nr:glycosyltransferase family 39 protein [Gemmatimonadaceae bacterium]
MMAVQDGGTGSHFWRWTALLVAGQAASLALIEAGNRVAYQHYRLASTGAVTWVAVSVLVVQAIVVVLALPDVWPGLREWLSRALPTRARLGIAVAVVLCAATLSKSPAFYVSETAVATLIQIVAIGNAILIGRAVAPASAMQRWARWFGPVGEGIDGKRRVDGFALACAAWVLVAAVVLAFLSYQRHPHVPDEVVYLFQARYLAEGVVTLPVPLAPLAFNVDLMHYTDTRWYSSVPPGWPYVLALGVKVGAPWLVNPVLGALNVLLAHAVLRSMYERRVARLATLLLATSPWFVFMSMNFMTHQATLFFALLGALAVARLRADHARGSSPRPSTLAAQVGGGLAIGAA